MNRYLKKFLSRAVYMKPLDDDQSGSTGGAAVDRGDTLSAGAPVVDAGKTQAELDADAEAERIRAEEATAAEAAKAAGGEGGEGGAPATGEKPGMIPVDRHKAVLDKARAERDALAEQLKQYQTGQAVAKTNQDITQLDEQVSAKEAEYTKLLADGEVEKATAVMREIRTLERQASELKVEMRTQAATAQAIESVRYGAVVERLEAAYPELNPDHEDFDKDQVQDVMDLKATYERRGATPSAALQKAVEKLMKPATAKQEQATSVKPRVTEEEAAAAAAAAAAATGAERKEGAVRKNLDAAAKTPPSVAKVGADSDKHGGGVLTSDQVMKMSQDQFAKLKDDDLARLRGDIV